MNADEEYEGGPDDLVGKLADLDEELAEQRATALRASRCMVLSAVEGLGGSSSRITRRISS